MLSGFSAMHSYRKYSMPEQVRRFFFKKSMKLRDLNSLFSSSFVIAKNSYSQ